jgi:vacuolar-type H+-ATPase subunit E/Vma4
MAEATPLLDLMSQQAAAQRESILADARREAEAIREAARREAEAHRRQTLAALDAELGQLARQERERAEAEAHMRVLTTKDSVAAELLAGVQAELARVAESADFEGILEALLDELLPEAPQGGVVLAPPAHVERVRGWLASRGREDLSVQPVASLRDGLAVQDAARSYRVTNTLSARFNGQEAGLRKLCIGRLFGGD